MLSQDPEENDNISDEKGQSHIGVAKYWRKRVERAPLSGNHEWFGYLYNHVLYHNAKVAYLNQRRLLTF
jgi:hypothetical protein